MKTLLLLRHAKSSRDGNWTSDIDRPLNDRGREDAPIMGKVLKKYELAPDGVLCSPAVRTRQTAELFLKAAGYKGDVLYADEIYDGSCKSLRDLIAAQQAGETILLIGHNPGMEELLHSLTGGGNATFPTSGLACVDFESNTWELAVANGGSLRWFLIPRLVRAL